VRFLDVVRNPTSSAITARYYIEQEHANLDWTFAATSSGDADFDASDDYVVIHEDAGSSEVAFVMSGPDATVAHSDPPNIGEAEGGRLYGPIWPSVTVPAGQTVILMQFITERPMGDVAGATSAAEALMNLSEPHALDGLSDVEKGQIVNFKVQQ